LDDDPDQAHLLAQALSSRSRRVQAFSDPIRALAALNEYHTDLLVADVSMPWIDGGDVVTSARSRRPQLKVILVSGFARGAEVPRRCQVPFFAKPIDVAALLQAAQAALR
jgi:DNA-binding NtrC family response regulator